MAKKLGDLLKKAYQDAGEELPKKDALPSKPVPPATPWHAGSGESPAQNRGHRATDQPNAKRVTTSMPTPARESVYTPSRPQAQPEKPKEPAYTLSLQDSSRMSIEEQAALPPPKVLADKHSGRLTTLFASSNGVPDYELTLGFDFGTSSTKLVIGDPQQDKAFAVPFFDTTGIEQYLLPGRLYRDSEYSLSHGKEQFRDLKLALLDNPSDVHREQTVAFMALAIRQARAWLFQNYESLYRDKHIFWNIAVGVPSTEIGETSHTSKLLEELALTAWIASTDADRLDSLGIQHALAKADALKQTGGLDPLMPEVLVYPEVYAQVFGFVSGRDTYDPRGKNIYLLVDIGAGTIDTSLFHVTKAAGNRWNFQAFTSTVEFNGAVNLHRSRLGWWGEAVAQSAPHRRDLSESLQQATLNTDCLVRIPARHEDYVSHSDIRWQDSTVHPDRTFMSTRVRPQILDNTYVRAWREGHLEQKDIFGVPTFLCGGGMRMPFFNELLKDLDRRDPNASWVHAKPRKLSVPDRLDAKGIADADYDRLSVAYGLSLMRMGAITSDPIAPKPAKGAEPQYRDSFVGKEMT